MFERLKAEQPNVEAKLCAITGDVQQDGLGIREIDRERLVNHVHVVFHSAATIRFDEPLR